MPMSRNWRHSSASLGFGFTKKRRSEMVCLTHEVKIGRGGVTGHLFHVAARVSSPRREQIFVINHPVFIRNLWASLCAGAAMAPGSAPGSGRKAMKDRCECGAAQLPAAIAC
jgi:hypothetical protein